MPTLRLQRIIKDYPGRRVLRGIDIEFEPGAVALLGPNGAGKSTLLSVLSTHLRPSSGSFQLDGRHSESNLPSLRQQIGVIGHSGWLYRDLTLRENLLLYARLYHVTQPEQRTLEVAEQFKLSKRLEQPVRELSRGLLQRAALARATLHKPALLLLDEPFTGLDPSSSQLLLALIQTWREKGRLVLFATHDLHKAAECADRFLILTGGRIQSDLPAPLTDQELLQHYTDATSKR